MKRVDYCYKENPSLKHDDDDDVILNTYIVEQTRMTKERLERLEALGFKWSTSKVSSKKPSELNTTSATTNNANNNNGETPNAMTQTTNDGTMMV